jgi:Ca-activated chloride channel family protein
MDEDYRSDTATDAADDWYHGGDSVTDTSPWPTSDGYADAPTDPGVDATSRDAPPDLPVPDAVPDVVEEEPPPVDDVCDLEITEPQVLYLSADDSNSMASPIIARKYIEAGALVPASVVRTYEFTNYYDISYEPAEPDHVNVQLHMMPDDEEGYYNMQIGAQAQQVTTETRRPLNITFAMDTSGSMGGTPIALEREVCRQVASSLKAGDVVSIVEWDVHDAVILDSRRVSGPDDALLLDACNNLRAGGGTNLHGGLTAAYALAEDNYSDNYLNRVVLVSDGQANAGITDIDVIAGAAEDVEREGIYLVGVGTGNGYDDRLMDDVTDAGKGAYVYIDSAEEARKIFHDRFLQTMDIAVMNVQVELTLPTWIRIQQFHGEEISGDPSEVEPQHLAPNDAMIFHQLVKMCGDPLEDDIVMVRANYVDRITRIPRYDEIIVTVGELLASQGDLRLLKGTAVVAYAEALKEIWNLKRAGYDVEAHSACASALAKVWPAAAVTGDAELTEMAYMFTDYCMTLDSR